MDSWRGRVHSMDSGGMGNMDLAAMLLGIYDRIRPERAEKDDAGMRYEWLRRNARHLDASGAVGAGQVLILAQSAAAGTQLEDRTSPLPFALEVDGKRVAGKGCVYWQFVVPASR